MTQPKHKWAVNPEPVEPVKEDKNKIANHIEIKKKEKNVIKDAKTEIKEDVVKDVVKEIDASLMIQPISYYQTESEEVQRIEIRLVDEKGFLKKCCTLKIRLKGKTTF